MAVEMMQQLAVEMVQQLEWRLDRLMEPPKALH
jgi:hypothetical protein